MKTLSLIEAATFLIMTPEGLRRKVAKGEIPGAKPGKCWVFSEDDLAEYLRSFYANNAKSSQGVHEMTRGTTTWHSTKERIRGGLILITTDEDYKKALGLKTK